LKFWNQVQALTTVDYSGTIADCTLVTQGDTDGTRDGDRLHLKSIRLRANCYGSANTYVRFILFQWFSVSVPTVANVLYLSGAYSAINSPHNPDKFPPDNNGEGKVLMDVVFDNNSTTPRLLNFYTTKFPKDSMQFTAGSTAGTNHIYLCTVSNVTSTGLPSLAWYSEFRFTDL